MAWRSEKSLSASVISLATNSVRLEYSTLSSIKTKNESLEILREVKSVTYLSKKEIVSVIPR